jgi:hypothetical protein
MKGRACPEENQEIKPKPRRMEREIGASLRAMGDELDRRVTRGRGERYVSCGFSCNQVVARKSQAKVKQSWIKICCRWLDVYLGNVHRGNHRQLRMNAQSPRAKPPKRNECGYCSVTVYCYCSHVQKHVTPHLCVSILEPKGMFFRLTATQ